MNNEYCVLTFNCNGNIIKPFKFDEVQFAYFISVDQYRKEKASSFANHVHDGRKEFRRKGRNATLPY